MYRTLSDFYTWAHSKKVLTCHSERSEESRNSLKNIDSSLRFAPFRMTKTGFLEWTHKYYLNWAILYPRLKFYLFKSVGQIVNLSHIRQINNLPYSTKFFWITQSVKNCISVTIKKSRAKGQLLKAKRLIQVKIRALNVVLKIMYSSSCLCVFVAMNFSEIFAISWK